MKLSNQRMALLPLCFLVACGGDDGGGEDPNPDPGEDPVPITVSGTVVDFATGEPVEGATVSVDGVSPAPTVAVTGSNFEIQNVPPFSTFHILAGAAPNYRSTYSAVVQGGKDNITGLAAQTVSEDFLDGLYQGFAIEDTNATVVIAVLLNEDGQPLAGVPGDAFVLDPAVEGPFFLDAERAPDPELSASSTSGIAVFFKVPAGLASFTAEEQANLTFEMADSPVAARTATLATVKVTDGAIELPENVSFADDVVPIFDNRGCVLCHSKNGIGKDLGGLHLNGEPNKTHREVAEEISGRHQTLRIDVQNPAASLLLTMPLREDPPDVHPNATFLSTTDPDYLTILAWITEGAKNN